MTVGELLERMTVEEELNWSEFFQLEEEEAEARRKKLEQKMKQPAPHRPLRHGRR